MQNLLHQNDDGTVSKIGYHKVGRVSGWRECRDINIQIRDNLADWLSTFATMLGAANAVDECVMNPKQRANIIGGVCCPVVCMRLWSVVCNRLVMARRPELQLARMTLPTPGELRGTVARSFVVMACDYVGERVDALVGVVRYKSASMPLLERAKSESEYVAQNFDQLSRRWPKAGLTAGEWFRLVESELNSCPWLTNAPSLPVVFSRPVTSKALRDACMKANLDFGNGNISEHAWRKFKNDMLADGKFRLADPDKPQGKLQVSVAFLNEHGIKLP